MVVQTKVVAEEAGAVIWLWICVDSKAKRLYSQTVEEGEESRMILSIMSITLDHFTIVKALLFFLHFCYFIGEKCRIQRISLGYPKSLC